MIAQLVKIHLQCRRPWFNSWVGKIHWRRDRLSTQVFLGFPCGSTGKESACSAGDLDSISGLGSSCGEGKGYPLQYSGLENCMDCIVHGVTKRWTLLSDLCAQSRPSLCNPIDCSLPGSSVHGIFQVRFLEWVSISFSKGCS